MKLKPCPFCGGEAKLCRDIYGQSYKVRCKNINCTTRPVTAWFKTEEQAIEKWNTRKPIEDIVSYVDRIENSGLGKKKSLEYIKKFVKGGAE